MTNSAPSKGMVQAERAGRELARRHFLDYVMRAFPNYQANWHHLLIIDALERVERGELKRLAIFMPPRHGKSELASVQFPAWAMGRKPERNVMQTSYSGDLSAGFGRKVRNEMVTKRYRNVFDRDRKGILSGDSKAANEFHTRQGGAYYAAGVGGAITGRGADILIIDDPVKNREEAESETIQKKNAEWYTSTARTRLSPDGAIVLIQTRWHDADLGGFILDDDEDGEWEVLSLPAVAERDEEHRDEGEALWPGQYSLEALDGIKRDIGSFDWSALYQQDPLDPESQEFRASMFKYRTEADMAGLDCLRFLTVDTAVSKKATACDTGFTDNRVDSEGFWNLASWGRKVSPLELLDELFTLQALNRYNSIGIEEGIYLKVFKPFLDKEQRKRGVFLPIVELKHEETAKELRIRSLLPMYESGSVFHLQFQCDDLEGQLTRFPKSKKDDVMDSAAYQTQIAQKPGGDDKKKKKRSGRTTKWG